MSRNLLEAIATDRNLTRNDIRVLLTLLANTQGFSAEIPQTEIAQKLGMKTSHVSRAIGNLCSKGFISKKRIGGKLVGYRFAVAEDSNANSSI